ncbi:cytochrome c3 family protein [Caldithrix abyssi]|uniref:Cytochrome c7 n=1 Tax=Caldithrix abyssi DSM 13497 TaxID=880073 RepID=H1XPN7_CALAY|nr:cytochrome c3 family protein [Caldithrix abyssi]APF19862.1 Cytochrome c7 [Caldithrix abyssi DSM 13497]EHO39958.1 hypothetical protein, secreted [Caldithrix abyssi DSM 13497]
MAQIFPKWTNRLPLFILIGAAGGIIGVVFFFWYFGSPQYTDVGYQPEQPVPYSHKLHVGDLGLDCRYCHVNVERAAVASVPPTQTCMNCHSSVATESRKLLPVRASMAENKPLEWTKVHDLPDFVYFDHSAHITAGVGCESCHGNVAAMEKVHQEKPLSMSWCLDCHNNPAPSLRPASEITTMNYQPPANQLEIAMQLIQQKNIKPPIDCSGCHR